jgi:hypothetical protein
MDKACVLRTSKQILQPLYEEVERPAGFFLSEKMTSLDLLEMHFSVFNICGQCLAIQPAVCGHQN